MLEFEMSISPKSSTMLEVALDAKVIVNLLKSNKKPNTAYSPLLSNCRLLLAMVAQVRVAHFDSPPSSDYESVLAMDCNGLYVCRIVKANVAAVLN
uniref:Uncharacterized protein n=1 Tax=Quercus lobata TaxID=97700 RepID=A0A7N2ML90_QUELO